MERSQRVVRVISFGVEMARRVYYLALLYRRTFEPYDHRGAGSKYAIVASAAAPSKNVFVSIANTIAWRDTVARVSVHTHFGTRPAAALYGGLVVPTSTIELRSSLPSFGAVERT